MRMPLTPNAFSVRAAAAACAVGALLLTSACASGVGPNTYSRGQVGAVGRVEAATVVEARPVMIEGTKSGVGTAAGAAIGGVAGSQVGGGEPEHIAAGIAGAVVGGLLGAAVEEGATRQQGTAYVVQMHDTGELLTITQADSAPLPPGAQVWVEFGPRARVFPRY